jgi:DNA (cytosine-5)-methyltransferase 1
MIYGSVCSGIEAASVAWGPLKWTPAWFSEIEEFPCQVLKYRFKDVLNLGDMTKIYDNPTFKNSRIDLLVGGTPCQSFSQAGKRLGLEDPRGNLALNFLRIAREKQPRWIVWENVPGVLSSGDGEDFATILQTMVESGYGVCYRMLDSRFFGLSQNRRRVFVVGYLGDWRRAAAVLFERQTPSDDLARDNPAEGRIPVCTVRNAGNANARGVVVAENFGEAGDSQSEGLRFEGKNLRRLTPAEEERRMGFSGEWTDIPTAVDSKRYKAIGNSMAIPVMRWIGEGIQIVDQIQGGNMAKAKYTPEQKQDVRNSITAGKSNKEIEAATGVGSGTISQIRADLKKQSEPIVDSLEVAGRKLCEQDPALVDWLLIHAKPIRTFQIV